MKDSFTRHIIIHADTELFGTLSKVFTSPSKRTFQAEHQHKRKRGGVAGLKSNNMAVCFSAWKAEA
ncbi:hypothetical protein P7K49_027155 [Saguinus oedipus]|uniref:Uncharacterized protein n=1 Tax=Saguinus oedipus TaxID=9490 RepID=A0ABQ9UG19_SAGOE|nr:hypothetical protein P7K49_027155 [Saguinus oedipus]